MKHGNFAALTLAIVLCPSVVNAALVIDDAGQPGANPALMAAVNDANGGVKRVDSTSPAGATTLFGAPEYKRALLAQIGSPESDIQKAVGFGNEVAFLDGVRQVVPEGWRGFALGAGVDTRRLVNWRGGNRPWTAVLEEMLGQAGLLATVDWTRKEISFRVDPDAPKYVAPASTQVAAKAAAIEGDAKSWSFKPGVTIEQALGDWAKRAGWKMVWSVKDPTTLTNKEYTLKAGDSYVGTFEAAVSAFFDSLPDSVPIKAELRIDNDPKVLYVTTMASEIH